MAHYSTIKNYKNLESENLKKTYVVGLGTFRSKKGSKLFPSLWAVSTSREATFTLYLEHKNKIDRSLSSKKHYL